MSWLSRLSNPERFRKYFGCYFPQILEDELNLASLMFTFEVVLGAQREPVPRSQANKELMRIRKMLKNISKSRELLLGVLFQQRRVERENAANEIAELVISLMMWRANGTLDTMLDRFIAETKAGIQTAPDRANIKWESVHAVEGLRFLWIYTGEQSRSSGPCDLEGKQIDINELLLSASNLPTAPARALNPESPFAGFLRNGFEYLEIDADPISAFKRWAALKGEHLDK